MIPQTVALLNIGPFELLLVAAAAVLLFGGDLPEVARKAARLVGRLRALTSELSREFTAPEATGRPPDVRHRLGGPELDEARRTLAEAARLDRTVPAGPGEVPATPREGESPAVSARPAPPAGDAAGETEAGPHAPTAHAEPPRGAGPGETGGAPGG